MAVTSKSPVAVLGAAMAVARRALPAWSHRNSPKKFTQHQLFACLVLKNFLKTDYRGVAQQLRDCPALGEAIGLTSNPHFTTLQKAAQRLLLSAPTRRILDATVKEQLGRRERVVLAAVDSTGLECTAASSYFVRRRGRGGGPVKPVVYHRFPKLAVVCDTASHFILAMQVGTGPKPDVADFRSLLGQAVLRVRMTKVVADAGYDSEGNHRYAREKLGVRTTIPPKHGRPTDKPARGRYRRMMQVRFNEHAYRQRAQVETVMSMIKRRQGTHAPGRTYHSQCRDLRLMALTHNIMILWRGRVFDRACLSPFIALMKCNGIDEVPVIPNPRPMRPNR